MRDEGEGLIGKMDSQCLTYISEEEPGCGSVVFICDIKLEMSPIRT